MQKKIYKYFKLMNTRREKDKAKHGESGSEEREREDEENELYTKNTKTQRLEEQDLS